MFSDEARCIYERSPLIEVICQLRFPVILTINSHEPCEFQELIRDVYPKYMKRDDTLPPKMVSGKPVPQGKVNNYQFVDLDGHWRVNLTQGFIALATNHYTCWEEFAKRLDVVLAKFIPLYHPACFERVGLRFVNSISRKTLELEECAWRDLIQPGFLGLLAEDDVRETGVMGEGQRYDLPISGGCRAKILAAPAKMKRKNVQTGAETEEAVFILDHDIYMSGNLQVAHAAGALQTIHIQADRIFRGAITPQLHQAMGPEPAE